jgi:hypothetical protein
LTANGTIAMRDCCHEGSSGQHAAAQVERERTEVGRGRYSLWTGDPGSALYLALCLDGSPTLPGFDDNDFV